MSRRARVKLSAIGCLSVVLAVGCLQGRFAEGVGNSVAGLGPLSTESEFPGGPGKISSAAVWDHVRSCFDQSLIMDAVSETGRYRLQMYNYRDTETEGEKNASN